MLESTFRVAKTNTTTSLGIINQLYTAGGTQRVIVNANNQDYSGEIDSILLRSTTTNTNHLTGNLLILGQLKGASTTFDNEGMNLLS